MRPGHVPGPHRGAGRHLHRRHAAAPAAARRGTRGVRRGGFPAQRHRPAGRCLAGQSLRLHRSRAPDGRDGARPGGRVPVAARGGRSRAGGRTRRSRAARGPAAGRGSATGPHLRRDHGRGRRDRLIPPDRGRSTDRHRRHRPARPGADRHDRALVGRTAWRPARSGRPAGARAGDRGGRDDGHDLAALPRRRAGRDGDVRHRVRDYSERHADADDRPYARIRARHGQRLVEPGLRRRIRGRSRGLRPVRRPHRVPGGVRPDQRADARGPARRPTGARRSR